MFWQIELHTEFNEFVGFVFLSSSLFSSSVLLYFLCSAQISLSLRRIYVRYSVFGRWCRWCDCYNLDWIHTLLSDLPFSMLSLLTSLCEDWRRSHAISQYTFNPQQLVYFLIPCPNQLSECLCFSSTVHCDRMHWYRIRSKRNVTHIERFMTVNGNSRVKM